MLEAATGGWRPYPGRLSRGLAWAWGRLVQSSPLILIEVDHSHR
jgi:hypothetical protein